MLYLCYWESIDTHWLGTRSLAIDNCFVYAKQNIFPSQTNMIINDARCSSSLFQYFFYAIIPTVTVMLFGKIVTKLGEQNNA